MADEIIQVVHAKCEVCGEWTRIELTLEDYGWASFRNRCGHCDLLRLDPRSVMSDRTFKVKVNK